MRPEIEPEAAARIRNFAPGPTPELRPIAFQVRFEMHQFPQRITLHDLAQSLEVSIPAAVLINRDEAAVLFCQANQFFRFGRGGGEWLVDYDVPSSQQASSGESNMRWIRRCNDNHFNGLNG